MGCVQLIRILPAIVYPRGPTTGLELLQDLIGTKQQVLVPDEDEIQVVDIVEVGTIPVVP
jgi:hypothetical protein